MQETFEAKEGLLQVGGLACSLHSIVPLERYNTLKDVV